MKTTEQLQQAINEKVELIKVSHANEIPRINKEISVLKDLINYLKSGGNEIDAKEYLNKLKIKLQLIEDTEPQWLNGQTKEKYKQNISYHNSQLNKSTIVFQIKNLEFLLQ